VGFTYRLTALRSVSGVLATLGDLVEDVVIRVDDPVNVASDTAATIVRRRGGSAANVAETAGRLGHETRFLGQVGGDAIGAALLSDLAASGVDTSFVRRDGRTGTIVVLVDPSGERTMLTDRGASSLLDHPTVEWLTGVSTLHVPMYSLARDPLAATTQTLIEWAHERAIAVSIDVSSVSLIDDVGPERVYELLVRLSPAVLFANGEEAAALGIGGPVSDAMTVIKHGAAPAVIHTRDGRCDVPAESVDVHDTTGAGDAFAAGFLTSGWRSDAQAACRAGHSAAAASLMRPRP